RRRLPAAGRRPAPARSRPDRGRPARVRESGSARRRGLLGANRGSPGIGARARGTDRRGGHPARSARRGLPLVVRSLAHVSCEALMSATSKLRWEPNPEQQAAAEARGDVFVSAGAGTGKTAVLVERFARAVCEEGVDVESILVITYTRRAAGE